MVAADVQGAVKALRSLYDLSFSSKRRGRFVLTREQLGQMLAVKKLHEVTVSDLQTEALEQEDLVFAELGNQLYGVVDAAVAARWRRIPKKSLADVLGQTSPRTSRRIEIHDDTDEEE
jgi:hypothetical protein